ncbi:MAG: CopY family transcriptional regulator [Streptosporangiaceae bacterium]|jgi:predicted transcriptional regulator|nr:CopY family transcriptional regulator [Streptosporangiaceae bacterium]
MTVNHGRRRGAGELESEVLAALWATDRPLTPADIQAALGGDLAYNTVHTILKRLWDKDLVIRDAQGRRGAYRPAMGAAAFTAEQMHELMEGADPLAVLQQFVSRLDPGEEQALRHLLDDGGRREAAP